jgi:hypothetical protein
MSKNLVALATQDHDHGGFEDGCQVCTTAFFARSREKWDRLQEKWRLVRQQSGRIDAQIVAAIMSPDKEEK